MKHVVLEMFGDAQDSNRTYMPGDFYPVVGLEPTAERIEELSTDKNRRGRPVIKAIEEAPVVIEVEEAEEVEAPAEEPIEEPGELEEDEPTSKRRRKKGK